MSVQENEVLVKITSAGTISIPGVKVDVNTVNIIKIPLYFHSRHENTLKINHFDSMLVNNKIMARRGLGSQR